MCYLCTSGKRFTTCPLWGYWVSLTYCNKKHICQVLQTKQNVINFCLRLHFDVSSTTILTNY